MMTMTMKVTMTMTMKVTILVALVIIGVLLVGTVNAGDAAAGKTKSATCAGCHGATGSSNNPMYPNLAGQKDQYLVKAIKAYRSGKRGDPTMKAMVSALSDADVENLAAFFSSQSCN